MIYEASATVDRGIHPDSEDTGRYGEGRGSHGLTLLVSTTTYGQSKIWQQRVKTGLLRDGRDRFTTITIGSWPEVSLDDARTAAFDNWRAMREGIDVTASQRKSSPVTFAQAAEAVIASREAAWKNPKTAAAWRARFGMHVHPTLGHRAIDSLTTADIVAVLRPLWGRPNGAKLAGCIGVVMAWAVGMGYRTDNPAEPAILDAVLGRARSTTTHVRALGYADVHDMLEQVRQSSATPSVKGALELLAYTAARSGEARGMTWDEVDLEAAMWTLSGERTKNGDTHRVPLSTQAVALLRGMGGDGRSRVPQGARRRDERRLVE